MVRIIMELDWTKFKKIIEKEFSSRRKRIMEIVEECDYSGYEDKYREEE